MIAALTAAICLPPSPAVLQQGDLRVAVKMLDGQAYEEISLRVDGEWRPAAMPARHPEAEHAPTNSPRFTRFSATLDGYELKGTWGEAAATRTITLGPGSKEVSVKDSLTFAAPINDFTGARTSYVILDGLIDEEPAEFASLSAPSSGSLNALPDAEFRSPYAHAHYKTGQFGALIPDLAHLSHHRQIPTALSGGSAGEYWAVSYGPMSIGRSKMSGEWTAGSPRRADGEVTWGSKLRFDMAEGDAQPFISSWAWSHRVAGPVENALPQVTPFVFYTKPCYEFKEPKEGDAVPARPWTSRTEDGMKMGHPAGEQPEFSTRNNTARVAYGMAYWARKLVQAEWAGRADELMATSLTARKIADEATTRHWQKRYAEDFPGSPLAESLMAIAKDAGEPTPIPFGEQAAWDNPVAAALPLLGSLGSHPIDSIAAIQHMARSERNEAEFRRGIKALRSSVGLISTLPGKINRVPSHGLIRFGYAAPYDPATDAFIGQGTFLGGSGEILAALALADQRYGRAYASPQGWKAGVDGTKFNSEGELIDLLAQNPVSYTGGWGMTVAEENPPKRAASIRSIEVRHVKGKPHVLAIPGFILTPGDQRRPEGIFSFADGTTAEASLGAEGLLAPVSQSILLAGPVSFSGGLGRERLSYVRADVFARPNLDPMARGARGWTGQGLLAFSATPSFAVDGQTWVHTGDQGSGRPEAWLTGSIASPTFLAPAGSISFEWSGAEGCSIALIETENSSIVHMLKGATEEGRHTWSMEGLEGKRVMIRITDESREGMAGARGFRLSS